MWSYWWYGDPNGPDPWHLWYDGLDAQTRGRHDNMFRFLETRSTWREPHAKTLDDGLVEIILKGKVQHRLLGFYGPNYQFTVVLPCIHKGTVYTPANALETARQRMRALQTGSGWKKRCVKPE
jgi:hypothetical protein